MHTKLDCPVIENKPALQNFRSFGNADYEDFNHYFAHNAFQPTCQTNINKMCEELYQYLDQTIEIYVPRRTRHRRRLALWITSILSNLPKKLKTQKNLL